MSPVCGSVAPSGIAQARDGTNSVGSSFLATRPDRDPCTHANPGTQSFFSHDSGRLEPFGWHGPLGGQSARSVVLSRSSDTEGPHFNQWCKTMHGMYKDREQMASMFRSIPCPAFSMPKADLVLPFVLSPGSTAWEEDETVSRDMLR